MPQLLQKAAQLWEQAGFAPLWKHTDLTSGADANRSHPPHQSDPDAFFAAPRDPNMELAEDHPPAEGFHTVESMAGKIAAESDSQTGRFQSDEPNPSGSPKERPVEDVGDKYVDTTPKTVTEPPATLDSLMERARQL